MKILITATVAALMMTSAAASASDDKARYCTTLGELAEMIMELRQSEMPMSMVLATKNFATGKARNDFEGMVTAAYKQPAYTTALLKDMEIKRFRHSVERSCSMGISIFE